MLQRGPTIVPSRWMNGKSAATELGGEMGDANDEVQNA
jgi:hypothetical protein